METEELGMTGMHIFLTGAIQVGKSTAIRRFLEPHPSLTLGGFRTVSVSAAEGESDSVHIIPPVGGQARAENRVMRRWQAPQRGRQLFPEVFDTVGTALLRRDRSADLILMDEIGFAEDTAPDFHRAVLERLCGSTPVLGVVRERNGVLGEQVKGHPRVKLLTVTEDNRDEIPELLTRWFRETKSLSPWDTW
jgi:nucleoside-triphosphatase